MDEWDSSVSVVTGYGQGGRRMKSRWRWNFVSHKMGIPWFFGE